VTVTGRPDREYTRPFVPDQADSAEEPEAVDGQLVPAPGEPSFEDKPSFEDRRQVAEVRRLPLPAEATPTGLDRRRGVTVPATVVAATGGFLLGVAAFVALRILRRPGTAGSLARRRGRLTNRGRAVDVQGTKSFLVDVHLLKR